MTFYELLTRSLTIIGYTLLTYRTVFQLGNSKQTLAPILESLSIKWIIFVLFIKFEPTIEAILQILPFGVLAVLALKCILVLPENTLALVIFKRIQKQLQRIEFEEYSSRATVYLSSFIKLCAVQLIAFAQKLVVYIKAQQIEQVEQSIIKLMKTIQYKKVAVQARGEVGKSGLRRELSTNSSLDESMDSGEYNRREQFTNEPRPSFRKTEVSQKMSKILENLDDNPELTVKAKEMVVKPNKDRNIRAVYDDIDIEFLAANKQIMFRNKHGVTQKDTLIEIKYVSKNMMTLELVLKRLSSKVIKLTREEDVINWMKPVVEALKSK